MSSVSYDSFPSGPIVRLFSFRWYSSFFNFFCDFLYRKFFIDITNPFNLIICKILNQSNFISNLFVSQISIFIYSLSFFRPNLNFSFLNLNVSLWFWFLFWYWFLYWCWLRL
jgi:hypothetical protein